MRRPQNPSPPPHYYIKSASRPILERALLMLLTTRYTKFAATYISAVGLLICFAQTTWAQNPTPAPVDLNIVAHQDDDILFMNPDILNTVYIAGHRQVTVYITAGN